MVFNQEMKSTQTTNRLPKLKWNGKKCHVKQQPLASYTCLKGRSYKMLFQACMGTRTFSIAITYINKSVRMRRFFNKNIYFGNRHLLLKNHHQGFHSTVQNKAIPFLGPALVKLATPLTRVAFLLLGRRFRNWWKKLSPELQEQYMGRFVKNQNRFLLFLCCFTSISTAYYIYHLEDTPVTGRKRFLILNNTQLEQVAEKQWEILSQNLDHIKLPVSNLLHRKVYEIAKRILDANQSKEVNALKWEVNVLDSNDVNAFVLANGQIFVFRGMIEVVANENELAGVLGHEMAHAILNHSSEQLSHAGLVNLFSIAVLTLLWAIVPTDGLALIASWLHSTIEDVLISLPYSRKLEKEADEVGLLLAARACYDVRHVPLFWQRMHFQEMDVVTQRNDWLSTHPSHESRVTWLHAKLPSALQLRADFKCPELTKFFDVKRMVHNNKTLSL